MQSRISANRFRFVTLFYFYRNLDASVLKKQLHRFQKIIRQLARI